MTALPVRGDEVRLMDVYLGQTIEEIVHHEDGWRVLRNADGENIGSIPPLGTVEVERPDPEPKKQEPACWVDPVDFAMSGCRFGALAFMPDATFTQPLYSEPVLEESWEPCGWVWEQKNPASGKWYPKHGWAPPEVSESVRNVRQAHARRGQ